MRKVHIAPSILSASFGNLARTLDRVKKGGADWLHLDVMDGNFVPNITFGPMVIAHLREVCDLFFDVHLMINLPERYIDEFIKAGADLITIHTEATPHVQRTLSYIRENGAKAGIALNPSTPLSALEWVLDDIDLCLIMSVNPGFGGQRFIPQMLSKIARAREIIDDHGGDILLEVDGGIKDTNVGDVVRAGADVVVAGSYTFRANGGDIEGNLQRLREAIDRAIEG